MSSLNQLTNEQKSEMSMVDIAFQILQSTNKPYHYKDLVKKIAEIKGLSQDQMLDFVAQVYTELNIDGRFVCVGQNTWGLKRWYPVDQQEDAAEGFMARDEFEDDELSEIDEDVDEDDFDEDDDDEDDDFDDDNDKDNDEDFDDDYDEFEEDSKDVDEDFVEEFDDEETEDEGDNPDEK